MWRTQVKNMSEDGLDLLQKTLEYDPSLRISAKAILEHQYFSGFEKKLVPIDWVETADDIS